MCTLLTASSLQTFNQCKCFTLCRFWTALACSVWPYRRLSLNLLLFSTHRNQKRGHISFQMFSRLFDSKCIVTPTITDSFQALRETSPSFLVSVFVFLLLIKFSLSSLTHSCPADMHSSQTAPACPPHIGSWTRIVSNIIHNLSFSTTVTFNTINRNVRSSAEL